MNMQEMNRMFVQILEEWDPLDIGGSFYETEIADVIQALQQIETVGELAKQMQAIYEFSFEILIPLAECQLAAQKLLDIEKNASCTWQ